MPLRADFKKKLIGLLKKFRLEEMNLIKSSVFPNISANQIHHLMEHFKLDITCRNVAEVLVHIYDKSSPNKDDCDEVLCQLYLLDAACHNHHTWGVVKLLDEVNELPDKLSDLNQAILKSYRTVALNANVHAIFLDNVVWSVVVERKILKKGGVKLGLPHFFGFKPDLDEPHVLFSPKTMDRDLHLQIYVESLGFQNYRLINYEGCNASAMMGVIERKCKGTTSMVPFSPYKSENQIVVKREGWNDYSEFDRRKKYAEQIFSSRSEHKYLKVECEELHADHRPTSASTISDFYSTMEFRSRRCSLDDMFKHLVTIGAVHFPLPNYMLHLSSTSDHVTALQTTNSIKFSSNHENITA